jgi:hypothetical protein
MASSLALNRVLLAIGVPRGEAEVRRAAVLLAHMIRDARPSKIETHALLDAVHDKLIERWRRGGRSRDQAEGDFDLLLSYLRQRMAR